jgi:hypothetical protein
MARAPSPTGAAAGGMMAPDPTAGAATGGSADPSAGGEADSGSDVVVTICKQDDGSYMVYAGDEPDADDSDDVSEDDAEAMSGAAASGGGGSGGGAGGDAQGQPADSIGAALKIAMDILQSDKSSEGAAGNADDQFAAGFGADKSPTPASGPSQKY